MLIQQSASGIVRTFLLTRVEDNINGYSGGAAVQVRLSKNGGAFAAAGAGAPILLESGIYKYVYTTAEVNTLGPLIVSCRASGADPTDFLDEVVGFNPQTAWQSTADIENRLNEYGAVRPIVSGRRALLAAGGHMGVDWANIDSPDTVVSLGGTTVRGSGMIITTVTGAVGSVTGNVGGNVVGSTGSIASSGILISSLQPEASNEIADRVLRRGLANVEAVADSRSLAWGVAKLVNKVAISSNTLTVNRTDDTTVVFSQAITTSGGALPIVSVDTT